ncbi:uncharacterized protein ASCRUDRAFT_70240 [Ascoidea rubescens DSM 1968]|uniref:Uncharacterized protein n=1 Tax=Ascoidea rubescens DSM 1968 TaxID=1344418 RepID=A0A1D2VH57_9ASCO|nr:hypothetical protein ASCRUDRAFT_70240 [Ascoidea rubescens DSM 1968]ODV61001.1 hypothetical protein ASCRUDRAFT_70240 [Ascoidea rubescens DSM 1968]
MTVAYEAHQNGVAKSWHKSIMTQTTEVSVKASASDLMCNESVVFVVLLPNAILTKPAALLDWFGCAAYALIFKPIRQTKLGDTSVLRASARYEMLRKTFHLKDYLTSCVDGRRSSCFDKSKFSIKDPSLAALELTPPSAGRTDNKTTTTNGENYIFATTSDYSSKRNSNHDAKCFPLVQNDDVKTVANEKKGC